MGCYIQTCIEFDLSKIQGSSLEDSFQRIRYGFLREMVKVSFSFSEHRINYIYYASSPNKAKDSEDSVLPKSILIYILSEDSLGLLKKNESTVSEAHTILPVKYHEESIEVEIDDWLEKKEPLSEDFMSMIHIKDSDLKDLDVISNLGKETCKNLTLDEKLDELLSNQELRDRIEVKYPFLHEAIKAYDSNNLQSTRPETWPAKKILSIIRSEHCDELNLLSMLSLRIQYERSQGKEIPHILTPTLQEKPLHIALFDVYQAYLDTLENIANRMSTHQSIYWDKCLKLFEDLRGRLKDFMSHQLKEGADLDPLRQNAWINTLQDVKDLFQWLEYFSFAMRSKTDIPSTEWNPFIVERPLDKRDIFKIDESQKYPLLYSLAPKKVIKNIARIIEKRGFNIEKYMEVLEEEVAKGIYTFSEEIAQSHNTLNLFKELLKPSFEGDVEERFVSGLGCHFEVSEELTERDLILMSYTALAPIGNFQSLRAFHDGHWRSSFWLRVHDSAHVGCNVRIAERIGLDVSDSSIHRYRKIDQMSSYLEIVHKILTLADNPLMELTEAERNYIALHLFMGHELEFLKFKRDVEILDIDFEPFPRMKHMSMLAQIQDLLFKMHIKVEGKNREGKMETILPGDYEIEELMTKAHPVYLRLKRDAFVEYINEKFLMANNLSGSISE